MHGSVRRKIKSAVFFKKNQNKLLTYRKKHDIMIVPLRMPFFRVIFNCPCWGRYKNRAEPIFIMSAVFAYYHFKSKILLLFLNSNRSFLFEKLQIFTGGAENMASDVRIKVTLACTECKQRNYDTTKNKRNDPDRLELRKYCKFCRKHTAHKETKWSLTRTAARF